MKWTKITIRLPKDKTKAVMCSKSIRPTSRSWSHSTLSGRLSCSEQSSHASPFQSWFRAKTLRTLPGTSWLMSCAPAIFWAQRKLWCRKLNDFSSGEMVLPGAIRSVQQTCSVSPSAISGSACSASSFRCERASSSQPDGLQFRHPWATQGYDSLTAERFSNISRFIALKMNCQPMSFPQLQNHAFSWTGTRYRGTAASLALFFSWLSLRSSHNCQELRRLLVTGRRTIPSWWRDVSMAPSHFNFKS